MRTQHGLFTRGVAALLTTSLLTAGCTGDGANDVPVEIRVNGGSLESDRTEIKVTYADGRTVQDQVALADPIIMLPAGPSRAHTEARLFYGEQYVGRGSTVGDVGEGAPIDIEVNQQATAFVDSPFASHVISPYEVGEGSNATIEVVLAPGVDAANVTGSISLAGPFADLVPPLPLEICGEQRLCGNYHIFWQGRMNLNVALDHGDVTTDVAVPVDGTWSEFSEVRTEKLYESLLSETPTTYVPFPQTIQCADFLGITLVQLAVLNAAIEMSNELAQPDLTREALAVMLAMIAVQPMAFIGQHQQLVIAPWIGVALRIAQAIIHWLRTRFAAAAVRTATSPAAREAAKQAAYLAAGTAITYTAGLLVDLYNAKRAKQAEYEKALRDKATQAELDRLKAELDAHDAQIEDLEKKLAEARQIERENAPQGE